MTDMNSIPADAPLNERGRRALAELKAQRAQVKPAPRRGTHPLVLIFAAALALFAVNVGTEAALALWHDARMMEAQGW